MPRANGFRHQSYTRVGRAAPEYAVRAEAGPPVGAPLFRQRMRRVGMALRQSGVAAVYLLDSGCAGRELCAVLSQVVRAFPDTAEVVGRLRQTAATLDHDGGDYSNAFVQCLASAINPAGQRPIPVRRFCWSGENHHLGRADGAVRLIDELASLSTEPGAHVLLWGHGHAGNVFALMTNLLAGDRRGVDGFFRAAEVYYRWPIVGCVDVPVWNRVRRRLDREGSPLGGLRLDLVTFGTPVRYGWESAGYARLLHFIHHASGPGGPRRCAAFPTRPHGEAVEGDCLQQLGIAGTDAMPDWHAWRCRWAHRRLEELLESGLKRSDLPERLRAGRIVPDEGITLLVDYGAAPEAARRHAGHTVYTRPEWLVFHAEEVARRFYPAGMSKAA